MEDWYADTPAVNVPTANEMDSITADERASLVGECPKCKQWTKFDSRTDKAICSDDGEPLLSQSIHTQRTFNPKRKKLSKQDLKTAS